LLIRFINLEKMSGLPLALLTNGLSLPRLLNQFMKRENEPDFLLKNIFSFASKFEISKSFCTSFNSSRGTDFLINSPNL